ncbi:hypothetical protein D3C76_1017220 [compost metagenome]
MQPLLQAVQHPLAALGDGPAGQFADAEQRAGALVGQQYALVAVQHQDAGAHALQDQGVEFFEIGHRGGALFGQGLGEVLAPGEGLDQQGRGEAHGAESARLHVVVHRGGQAEAEIEGQVDQPDARHRGHQQADASAQQHVGDRHRDHHQVADPAGDAAGGIEQRAEHQHVHQRQHQDRQHLLRARHQHGDEDVDDQVEPAADMEQLRVAGVEQVVVEIAGDQQDQQQADAQAVQVVEAEDVPPVLAGERDAFTAHGWRGPARDGRGCSTSAARAAAPGYGERARRTGRSAPSVRRFRRRATPGASAGWPGARASR